MTISERIHNIAKKANVSDCVIGLMVNSIYGNYRDDYNYVERTLKSLEKYFGLKLE